MLNQPTIEKLLAMHLDPMVETWRSFEQDENAQQLSFEEKLSLMVDRLWTWRQNLALERRLRYAKLRGNKPCNRSAVSAACCVTKKSFSSTPEVVR